jgi:hypothetical protein
MDVRQYDPTIARFTGIDPVTHHSMSTYTAFDNNPVYWADPSGANAGLGNAAANHSGGASGISKTGDTGQWNYNEKDKNYTNSSTGETTNDVDRAVGETVGAFGAYNSSSNGNRKLKFDKEIDNVYGDKADQPAPNNKETVYDMVKKIPTLKELSDTFTTDFEDISLFLSPSFVSKLNGADAYVYTDNGRPDGIPKLNLFRASFNSHRILAQTLYHEFWHISDYYTGTIYRDYLSQCQTGCNPDTAYDIAIQLSEIRAYTKGNKVTGTPFTRGYKRAVNRLENLGINY